MRARITSYNVCYTKLLRDKLPNNGLESAGWDAYTSIVGSVVNLNAGTSTLKIKAGTEAYAWNLDKIELAKIAEVATDVDVVSSSKVEFYPNPANDVLNVSGLQGEYYQFTITNMAGVPVISSSFNGLDNAKVDISKLTDGVITSYSIHYTKLYDYLLSHK